MAGGGGLAPLSVACPLCGRSDFPSAHELERHAASCRGLLEPDRLDARTLMAPTKERRRREGAGAAQTGPKPAKKATLDEYLADDTEELCAFCGRPKEEAPSRLIFSGSAEGGMFCAHVLCALYNSGVGPETDESGPSIAAASLKELDRARQYKLNCTLCKKRRALIGCIAKGCKVRRRLRQCSDAALLGSKLTCLATVTHVFHTSYRDRSTSPARASSSATGVRTSC